MIISSYKYFQPINITEDVIYTLVIENGHEYRNIIRDLAIQIETNRGEFVLSEDNEGLDFSKNCELLTDMFSVNLNDKRILTKIQKEIIEEYMGTDDFYQTVIALNNFGNKIVNDSEYSLSFNSNLALSDIVKTLSLTVSLEENSSLLECITEYFALCKKLLEKQLFITVGFKDFMLKEEFNEFKKMIEYKKIRLLMIERYLHEGLDDRDALIIIDKDLCVL